MRSVATVASALLGNVTSDIIEEREVWRLWGMVFVVGINDDLFFGLCALPIFVTSDQWVRKINACRTRNIPPERTSVIQSAKPQS